MTTLRVSIDAKTPMLTQGAKQIPFALSKAVNASVVTAQQKQLAHMRTAFIIRREPFLKRSVKITKFAKKFDPVGILAIDSPQGRADIFAKFEAGGTKRPTKGANLAIPIVGGPAKRTAKSVVQAKFRPRNLLADPQSDAKGAKKAFLRPAKDGKSAMIFVRQGKRLKLAYVLEPSVPIKPELKFEEIVTTSVKQTFADDFTREFANALKTAK